jgi:hypothetical protein
MGKIPQEKTCWRKAEQYRDHFEGIEGQFHAIEERLKSQKARAEALRDGVSLLSDRGAGCKLTILKLFNASAVVESRLSTKLAQNVKLLIYVSIFYLPLAFCAVGPPYPLTLVEILTKPPRHYGQFQISPTIQQELLSLSQLHWLHLLPT